MIAKKISPFLNRYRKGYPCGIIYIGLMGVLILSIVGVVFAQEKEKAKKSLIQEVSGEVSAISKDFIAIVYKRDAQRGSEEEIGLPLAKDVRLEHKKSLDEINVGDIVSVQLEEYVDEDESGKKVNKRRAKIVSFIRAAAKAPEAKILDSGALKEAEE